MTTKCQYWNSLKSKDDNNNISFSNNTIENLKMEELKDYDICIAMKTRKIQKAQNTFQPKTKISNIVEDYTLQINKLCLSPILVSSYSPETNLSSQRVNSLSGKMFGTYKPKSVSTKTDKMKNGGRLLYISKNIEYFTYANQVYI